MKKRLIACLLVLSLLLTTGCLFSEEAIVVGANATEFGILSLTSSDGSVGINLNENTVTVDLTTSGGGGGGDAFGNISCPFGTDPIANGNDTLNLTSDDGSVTITGDYATDTVDLSVPDPSGLFVSLDPATNYVVWRMSGVGTSPRTATISAVAGDTITLTANVAYKFYDALMEGYSYVKISNTSRGEYAWVKAVPAANQLQVVTAADIAAWVNGNTISTACDGAVSPYTEIDVSPSIGATDKGVAFVQIQVMDTGAANAFGGVYSSATGLGALGQCTQAAGLSIFIAGPVPLYTGNRLFPREIASGAATLLHLVFLKAYTT